MVRLGTPTVEVLKQLTAIKTWKFDKEGSNFEYNAYHIKQKSSVEARFVAKTGSASRLTSKNQLMGVAALCIRSTMGKVGGGVQSLPGSEPPVPHVTSEETSGYEKPACNSDKNKKIKLPFVNREPSRVQCPGETLHRYGQQLGSQRSP